MFRKCRLWRRKRRQPRQQGRWRRCGCGLSRSTPLTSAPPSMSCALAGAHHTNSNSLLSRNEERAAGQGYVIDELRARWGASDDIQRMASRL